MFWSITKAWPKVILKYNDYYPKSTQTLQITSMKGGEENSRI